MPFYEYECSSCKYYTEVLQKLSDPVLRKCPSCGKSSFKKLVSAPVFRLKGSGWYETDFKGDKDKKRNLAGDESRGGDDKSGDDKSGDAKKDDAKKPEPAKAEAPASAPEKSSGEKPAPDKRVAGKPAAESRPATRSRRGAPAPRAKAPAKAKKTTRR